MEKKRGRLAEHHRMRSLRDGSILCIWPRPGRYGRIFGSLSRVGTNWLCTIARIITRFLRRMPLGARECAERSNRPARPRCAEYVLRIRPADKRYPILFESTFLSLSISFPLSYRREILFSWSLCALTFFSRSRSLPFLIFQLSAEISIRKMKLQWIVDH